MPTLPTTPIGADITQIYLTTSTTQTPGNVEFSSPGPGALPDKNDPTKAARPPTASTNYCGSNTGTGGWCNNTTNSQQVSSFTFDVTYLNAVTVFGVTGSLVSHSSGSGTTTGANAIVFEEVCPGTLTFSTICTGYQAGHAGIVNGNFNTLPFDLGLTFGATTELAVRITVLLGNHNGSGSFATLTGLDTFDTPEPQTLGLIGFGLAGLGLLRYRRKR